MKNLAQQIRRERERLAERRAELLAQLEEVTLAVNELEAAERVIDRFVSSATNDANISEVAVGRREYGKLAGSKKGTRKPSGLPTIPELINLALSAAEKEGLSGLRPSEVLKRVQANWWPDAVTSDITPAMARLANGGKLIRNEDQTYSRVKQNGTPTYVNGAGSA